ncbi:MAG: TatD family hydrolase [Candidatus Pelagibacter sp.]
MIDSHCHLDHEPLFENLNKILENSKKVGVEKILTISTTKDSYNNVKKIVKLDPIIFGSIGVHPHETKNELMTFDFITNEFKENQRIIGIGETGLDYYYENSNKVDQIKSFKVHIEASIKCNCPLIVHSRNAEEDTFKILNEYSKYNPKILMHCFTGSKRFAEKLLNLNSYFSASGIITFKNSKDLQETFKFIPKDKVLIETDSPFLAPIPMRGKKNEPSYISYTLEHLAKIKKVDKKNMDFITTDNFNKLFFTDVS